MAMLPIPSPASILPARSLNLRSTKLALAPELAAALDRNGQHSAEVLAVIARDAVAVVLAIETDHVEVAVFVDSWVFPMIRIPRAPPAIILAPHAPLVAAHIVAIGVIVRIPHIVATGIGIKDVPRIRVSAAAGNNVVEEPAVEIKVGLDGGIEREERAE
ncbi:hypothetical protein V492_05429 [Pseudogymnoascus sp. VKM F-4246]|nr:hypothetical protein V492_05429 [Pseudogymnoascus sp. VKM F-4246]